jgi:hypothetical protein
VEEREEVWHDGVLRELDLGVDSRGSAFLPFLPVDSDPQRGLKTFTSNPVNSHELVAGGKGMQMMLVNTARGEIVTRVRKRIPSRRTIT